MPRPYRVANTIVRRMGDSYITTPLHERSPRPSQCIPGRCSEKGCPYQPTPGCGDYCRRCWELLFGEVPQFMRRRGNQMREVYEMETSLHGVAKMVKDNKQLKISVQAARNQWREMVLP